MPISKRSCERANIRVPVQIELQDMCFESYSDDMSMTGISIPTESVPEEAALEIGTVVNIVLKLQLVSYSSDIVLKASVVRLGEETIGFKFKEMEMEVFAILKIVLTHKLPTKMKKEVPSHKVSQKIY